MRKRSILSEWESKKNNVKKKVKDIKLSSDTLKELEVFWDAILRAFTNLCKTQAYPYYRDLRPTFDFKLHLVCDPKNFRCSQHEFDQGLHNYRSFGDVLRIFLHTNPTITEDNSPKAYLRLLSMCDLRDGFQILQELVFSLSPQLSGDYYDFRIDIGNITIQPGEHLSKFYQRVIQLSTEITLANIPNGGLTELAIRYLTFLRSTNCPIIIGILTPYWKTITSHRRDPKHLTKPLPWTFKGVYDDLMRSDISIIPITTQSSTPLPTDPIVARGSSTISIHHTKGGRRFLAVGNNSTNNKPKLRDTSTNHQKPPCKLCLNKHTNPWHSEDNCPYKHPTHIIPKDIRERVMQHNALHGAENRNYSKNQDTPDATKTPPIATGHSAVTTSTEILPELPSDQSASNLDTDSPQATIDDLDPTLEIVNTEYFDVPFPPATANRVTSTSDQTPFFNDIDPDEIITDHLQYLSYNS